MAVSVARCKRWLASVWFVGGGLVFFVVLVQTLLGRYGEDTNEIWGWLLPTVVPTLSLIIGVLVFDAVQNEKPNRKVDRFLFRLTVGLSAAYLASVFLVIALQPLAAAMGSFFVKAAHADQTASSGDSAVAT